MITFLKYKIRRKSLCLQTKFLSPTNYYGLLYETNRVLELKIDKLGRLVENAKQEKGNHESIIYYPSFWSRIT